jgi:hypothetical protein
MLEAARFALMRHFLCSEELLSGQTFFDGVSVLGRQLGVRITGYCRGDIEPHMGAYAVLSVLLLPSRTILTPPSSAWLVTVKPGKAEHLPIEVL